MGKKFKLKRLLRLNYKIKRIVRLYNPFVGATGGIRTPDLPVRSRTLYPTKLQLRDNTYYTLKSKNIQQNFEKNVAIIKKVCYIIQVLKKIEAQRSWQRAWFGTMRSQVRSLSPRPYLSSKFNLLFIFLSEFKRIYTKLKTSKYAIFKAILKIGIFFYIQEKLF